MINRIDGKIDDACKTLIIFYGKMWRGSSHNWKSWLQKVNESKLKSVHEGRLCALSKPTKLSPLAFVWTPVWWELVCLVFLPVVMVSEGGEGPPTQLPPVPGIGHTKAQCDGVIAVAAQSCRMCQHVIDSSVWLPCPTLFKSQCPQTIHRKLDKKHVY